MGEEILVRLFLTVLAISGGLPLLKWLLTEVGDFVKWFRRWRDSLRPEHSVRRNAP